MARSRSGIHLTSILLGLTLCIAPHRASAEEAPANYDEWVDEGLRAFDQGNLTGALTAFENANAQERSAGALRAMGVVCYRQGRYARALVLLRQALVESNRPLKAEVREATEKLARQASRHVGYLAISSTVPNIVATVDGDPALYDAEGRMVLCEGSHMIRVAADGFYAKEAALQIVAGQKQEWVVELEPTVASGKEPALGRSHVELFDGSLKPGSTHAVAPPPSTTLPEDTVRPHTLTWVALGAAPVFALGAGLAWHGAVQTGNELAETCAEQNCTLQERDVLLRASPLGTYEKLANVGIALTSLSLVTAGVSYLLYIKKSKGRKVKSHGATPALSLQF